ncbi:hypothetical protein D9M71_715200 [compost metagenome]
MRQQCQAHVPQHGRRYRSLGGIAVEIVRAWVVFRDARLGQFFVHWLVAGDENSLFLFGCTAMILAPGVAAMIGADNDQPILILFLFAALFDGLQQ